MCQRQFDVIIFAAMAAIMEFAISYGLYRNKSSQANLSVGFNEVYCRKPGDKCDVLLYSVSKENEIRKYI